jgi:hypothetical protein
MNFDAALWIATICLFTHIGFLVTEIVLLEDDNV